MNLSTMLEDTTLRNFESIFAASALANNVFPVPGGPYNSSPFGALIPTLLKSSGLVIGSSIASLIVRS